MKRIEFIAPVESMRGNLSGSQTLVYRENNNPAYDAPNGDAHALNYQPRFVGAKRSKDGLKYFSIRTKSTTKLNAVTRLNMALTGVVAIISSRLMTTQSATWASINSAFNYLKSNNLLPEGAKTFRKWVDLNLRNMLKFNQGSWSFTQASISFTVSNPFSVTSGELELPRASWVKFAQSLAFNAAVSSKSGIYFKVDGLTMFAPFKATQAPSSFGEILAAEMEQNPNMYNNLSGLAISSSNVTYKGAQLYTSTGTAVTSSTIASGSFTTIAPQA